jgi:hypothetical protein
MRPRIYRNYLSLKGLQVCEVVFVLIVSAIPVLAATKENVVARKNVSQTKREELALRLRTITGWSDLAFNADGALKIGHAGPKEGSKSARDLLNRAFSGNRVILLEDASSRKDVVFCRVVQGVLENPSNDSSEVYVVLIDFADFDQVSGDKPARAAFDVGWAFLHEIDHVVEDSQDPLENVAGDCESHINQMRRELGLPTRNSYFYSFLPLKNDGNLISRFVRLGFDSDAASPNKRKRYWLIWDAAVVGGLPSDSGSVAAVEIF